MKKSIKKSTANGKSNGIAIITAVDFLSMSHGKGKPARPEGMSNAEWFKVMANIREDKMERAMMSVARLASQAGFDKAIGASIKTNAYRLYTVIKNAFEKPVAKKSIKKDRIIRYR